MQARKAHSKEQHLSPLCQTHGVQTGTTLRELTQQRQTGERALGNMPRVVQTLSKYVFRDNGFPDEVPATHSSRRVKHEIDIDDPRAETNE